MVLRPLDKVESREPSPFSHWAVTPPEQSPCLLLLLHQLSGSGAGWAESSKAGRLSSPDTRFLSTPPNPTPPNVPTPPAPGTQARSLALSLGPQQKLTVSGLPHSECHSSDRALTRQTGASRSSPSAAGWSSPPRTQAASCRPRWSQTRVSLLRRRWGSCCSWRRRRGCWRLAASQVHWVGA